MPGEPVTEPEDEPTFEDSLAESKLFTLRGCEEKGEITIPKTLFNFIYNVSAYCTDSEANDKKIFDNKEAMFEALDLIYKVLDEQLHSRISNIEWEKAFIKPSVANEPSRLLGEKK